MYPYIPKDIFFNIVEYLDCNNDIAALTGTCRDARTLFWDNLILNDYRHEKIIANLILHDNMSMAKRLLNKYNGPYYLTILSLNKKGYRHQAQIIYNKCPSDISYLSSVICDDKLFDMYLKKNKDELDKERYHEFLEPMLALEIRKLLFFKQYEKYQKIRKYLNCKRLIYLLTIDGAIDYRYVDDVLKDIIAQYPSEKELYIDFCYGWANKYYPEYKKILDANIYINRCPPNTFTLKYGIFRFKLVEYIVENFGVVTEEIKRKYRDNIKKICEREHSKIMQAYLLTMIYVILNKNDSYR